MVVSVSRKVNFPKGEKGCHSQGKGLLTKTTHDKGYQGPCPRSGCLVGDDEFDNTEKNREDNGSSHGWIVGIDLGSGHCESQVAFCSLLTVAAKEVETVKE